MACDGVLRCIEAYSVNLHHAEVLCALLYKAVPHPGYDFLKVPAPSTARHGYSNHLLPPFYPYFMMCEISLLAVKTRELLYVVLFLLFMFGGLHPAVASQNTHKSHHHLHGNHRRTHHAVDDAGSAQDTLHEALKALRVANKLRVENVQSNNYQLRTAAGSAGEKSEHSSVPLLDYLDATGGESLVKARLESTNRSGTIEPKLKYGYSLSPQLIQAAKEIAESQPPTPSDVDYAAIARKVRAKYSLANNDTNSMPQKLIGPDGLSEYVPYEHTSRELQQPLQRETSGRAAAPYWMAEMEQNGVSPFAPPDYKVYFNISSLFWFNRLQNLTW